MAFPFVANALRTWQPTIYRIIKVQCKPFVTPKEVCQLNQESHDDMILSFEVKGQFPYFILIPFVIFSNCKI